MLIKEKNMRKILIVEEDILIRERLSNLLRDEGYYVIAVKDRSVAINCLERESIEIMIIAEKIIQENGFELLSVAKQRWSNIVIIAFGENENAYRVRGLLTKGIYEYLSQPLTPSRVLSSIKRTEERITLLEENKDLKRRIDYRYSFAGITGVSEKMQKVFSLILQVSQIKRPILLLGESGTGKEMIARAIHKYAFPDEKGFYKILCSNLPPGALKGKIFYRDIDVSSKKDALDQLLSGTIYFEDIHLLPYPLQIEFIDFLEENRFSRGDKDLHIITSTEVPLEEEVARGMFRNDLFYFLNAVKIEVPSLRERMEDIPFLIDVFLKEIEEGTNKKTIKISKEALNLLLEYHWPGNITELKNTLEGMVILSESELILPEDIPVHIKSGIGTVRSLQIEVGMPLEQAEKILIWETLKANRFNKSKSAQILGIGLRTLYRKIEQYNLDKQ
ncbi:Transcriptional regulatory protein ZraR [Atribacter laminatus]|uniref:Transcriptional regulatory protein ZraR n=2 Tax=Atribacter laminatus TaxID=2847778 RepID=A0A7T1AKD6_ATRLM|nr:Transcriptional regulatory protein ZraR [Atribacter laminatus]